MLPKSPAADRRANLGKTRQSSDRLDPILGAGNGPTSTQHRELSIASPASGAKYALEMADQGPEFDSSIHSACLANAGEAAAALERAFGGSWQWSFSPVASLEENAAGHAAALGIPQAVATAGNAAGWGCSFKVNHTAVLLLASDPANWFAVSKGNQEPLPAQKLQVLAQELGAALVPDVAAPGDCRSGRIEDLSKGLQAASVRAAARYIQATLTRDGENTTAWLLWPVSNAEGHFLDPSAAPSAEPRARTFTTPPAPHAANPGGSSPLHRMVQFQDLEDGLPLLPQFSRSLLRIRVPVVVTLAETRQTVGKVLEICPGSIIQFNKSCEKTLALEVGSCKVAAGEAVKVGDKLGLRVTQICPHQERFRTVRGRNS